MHLYFMNIVDEWNLVMITCILIACFVKNVNFDYLFHNLAMLISCGGNKQ